MSNINFPVFLQPYSIIAVDKSKPALPAAPPKPEGPKLIKKNWFQSLILGFDGPQDQAINANRMAMYEVLLEKYQIELGLYHKRVKKILSETNTSIYHVDKRKEVLKCTTFADLSTRETLKGRYEGFFSSFLRDSFGQNIHDNLEFQLPNGNAFVPDFAYVDKSTGICIDIEIDEPYTSDCSQPIHYIGADDYRNNFFQGKGWFVVRFAEEQIVIHQDECCNYLQMVVKSIKENHSHPVFPYPVLRWSQNEAFAMMGRNVRNSY